MHTLRMKGIVNALDMLSFFQGGSYNEPAATWIQKLEHPAVVLLDAVHTELRSVAVVSEGEHLGFDIYLAMHRRRIRNQHDDHSAHVTEELCRLALDSARELPDFPARASNMLRLLTG